MSVLPSDIRCYGAICAPAYDGSTTLNGALSSSVTALVLTSATGFPPSGEFPIQVDSEIIWVTQGAGTVNLTGIRAFAATAAATHGSSASVSMPAGGGIDFTSKVDFTDIVSGHTVDVVSSLATDAFAITVVTGRDTAGVLHNETQTLNGTTLVTGSQVWDRLEQVTFGASTTINVAAAAASTVINVAGHATLPAAGSCNIKLGGEMMTVTGGLGTNALTVSRGQGGTTATIHNSGDNVYLMAKGDVAVVDHTKIITNHTAQSAGAASGTQPAYLRLQSGDAASVSIGQIVRTQGGTGPNQIKVIVSTSVLSGGIALSDAVAVDSAWGTLPDNTTTYDVWNGMKIDSGPNPIATCRRFLWNAAADVPGGSSRSFYQKLFAVNNNTSTTGTSGQLEVVSDTPALPGTSALDMAMATSQNDTVSWANRQTAPASGYGSFVTQPVYIPVASPGNLPSGAAPNAAGAQGLALRLTLSAGSDPYKGTALVRAQVTTV